MVSLIELTMNCQRDVADKNTVNCQRDVADKNTHSELSA